MTGVLVSLLVSQGPFARAYGGGDLDRACSVIRTSDGGVAVAGTTWSFDAGWGDLLVIKLNPSGNPDWARTYGGTDGDEASCMIQTQDGGFAMAGWTWSFGSGNTDLLVIRTDASGSPLWTRVLGGTGHDRAYSVIQTSDAGFAVAGMTHSFGYGWSDVLVIKMDSSGAVEWAMTFGGTDGDEAQSIIQTSDGGFVVAGLSSSFSTYYNNDFFVLRLTSSGDLLWSMAIGGDGDDRAFSVAQAQDGGYLAAGETYSFGSGAGDFFVVKLSPSGSVSWAKAIGGTEPECAYSMIRSADGGYALAGNTVSVPGNDVLIAKITPSGSLEWARRFDQGGAEFAYSVTQTVDSGYAIAGETPSFGAGTYDFLVLKVDKDGGFPDCVADWTPAVVDASPTTQPPYMLESCSPGVVSPVLTTGTPSPTVTDVCPVAVEENGLSGPRNAITCSPIRGGALFLSSLEAGITIYSVDGRVAYSGQLEKGENRISLDRGVYLWIADCGGAGAPAYPVNSGKVAVR